MRDVRWWQIVARVVATVTIVGAAVGFSAGAVHDVVAHVPREWWAWTALGSVVVMVDGAALVVVWALWLSRDSSLESPSNCSITSEKEEL